MNVASAPAQCAGAAAALAEDPRQDVVHPVHVGEARVAGIDMGSVPLREVPIVALAGAFGARGIDLAAIETGALVRIAQEIVSGRDLLECFLGLLVAGIEVRVQLLGQLAVRFLYLLLRCLPFHSQ